MERDRILVTADPAELRADDRPGIVDVYDALGRQFFWADTVMIGSPPGGWDDEQEVLVGEVVA
jgi:phage terminase large subunit-like protein